MLPLKQLKNKGLYAWMNNLLLVIALTACTPAVLQPGANRVMIINQSQFKAYINFLKRIDLVILITCI